MIPLVVAVVTAIVGYIIHLKYELSAANKKEREARVNEIYGQANIDAKTLPLDRLAKKLSDIRTNQSRHTDKKG